MDGPGAQLVGAGGRARGLLVAVGLVVQVRARQRRRLDGARSLRLHHLGSEDLAGDQSRDHRRRGSSTNIVFQRALR